MFRCLNFIRFIILPYFFVKNLPACLRRQVCPILTTGSRFLNLMTDASKNDRLNLLTLIISLVKRYCFTWLLDTKIGYNRAWKQRNFQRFVQWMWAENGYFRILQTNEIDDYGLFSIIIFWNFSDKFLSLCFFEQTQFLLRIGFGG